MEGVKLEKKVQLVNLQLEHWEPEHHSEREQRSEQVTDFGREAHFEREVHHCSQDYLHDDGRDVCRCLITSMCP